MKKARLILGDQLNYNHSWFNDVSSHCVYVMMEVRQETDYVPHHIQKIVAFFSAMRSFADFLQKDGHTVVYYRLNDENNHQTFEKNLNQVFKDYHIEKFEYMEPDEYRLDEQLSEYCKTLDIEWECVSTEHFLTSRMELEKFFKGKKTYLMESFYRYMRKKYDVLMEGGKPLTGQWNYDSENRKKLPKEPNIPPRIKRTTDVSEIYDLIKEEQSIKYIGLIDPHHFRWPTSRKEALDDLESFCVDFLESFGMYQDAMHSDFDFNYHSLLSFALNAKILHPNEVIDRVVKEWESRPDVISIAQVEGFIRQILGWREFMRGIYWAKMPNYAQLNELQHENNLPSWFWDGKTSMKCLNHAISQSLEHSYAHHIQRLMVTGNFALLAGVDPNQLDQWYLGIYIDAIEWVEITNTRGMSQFADGGIVGTKPYVSSANYIKKMSNYCSQCSYKPDKKTGDDACPFNSLYWHFYDRHRSRLERNPRIGMMYRTWDRMNEENKHDILAHADSLLSRIDEL